MTERDRLLATKLEASIGPETGFPPVPRTPEAEVEALHAALSLAQRRTDALIWATSEIVWWADAKQLTGGGRGWTEFTGQDADAAEGSGWIASVHPADRARAADVCSKALAGSTPYVNEYRLFHAASQEWRWVVDRATPLIDADGSVIEWLGIISDVHDRKTAEQALRTSEERLRLAVEASGVGIWDVDLVDGTRVWSDQIKTMLGIDLDTAADEETLFERVYPADRETVRTANLTWTKNREGTSEVVFRVVRKDTGAIRWIASSGRAYFDAAGRPVRRVGTWQDFTERKLAEEQVWAAANIDPLTSLANRGLFHSRLQHAVRDAAKTGCDVGLLVVDLDHFKEINDTLGHDAGDQVLRVIADRVAACVTAVGTIARLGGDEFAILLPNLTRVDMAALSRAVNQAVAAPIHCGAVTLNGTVSIGSSRFPHDDPSGVELLKNADLALYAAKAAGRNRYVAFEPALKDAVERRVAVLRSARTALDVDAIVPFYQPKISLTTDAPIGFEALLRWRSPSGVKGPAAIQDALDDPELAVRIGDRMLSKVIADIVAWRRSGIAYGRVALNVSSAEFASIDVAERTLAGLRRAGLPTDTLEIEVVESVLLNDAADLALDVMHRLQRQGVTLSLDDFGTGYASLTHLRRFPVKWLKIDRSFLRDLPKGGAAAAIVRSVVGLAHDLNMCVVAEGVEVPSQLQALSRMGCDAVQGFLVAKPMAASRVPFFLRNWSGLTERAGLGRAGQRSITG